MKRLFALFLVLALMLALMAGCASETVTPEATQTPEAPEPVEASAEPEAAPDEPTAEEPPVEEVIEETPSITYPLCEETTEFSIYTTSINFMGAMANVDIKTFDDFDFVQAVEDVTNIHIIFNEVSFMSYSEQFNLYIAAGEYDDMILNISSMYSGGAGAAYEDGVIMDLTDIIDENAPDYMARISADANLFKDCKEDDGRIFDIKSMYDEAGCKNGDLIRKDWLDKLGMDVPETVEEYHDAVLAFKTEMGAEHPIYLNSYCETEANAFGSADFNAGGGSLGFYVVDGQVQCSLLSEGYKRGLELLAQWYSEGLINEDFATIAMDPNSADLKNGIANGTVGVWATQLEGIDDYKKTAADPDFEVAPMPYLVENEGEINHLVNYNLIDGSAVSISSQCEDPELCLRWINYWYTPEGVMMYNYGPEGLAYDLGEDGNASIHDDVINNDLGVDLSSILRMYSPYGNLFGLYLRGRLNAYQSELQVKAAEIWTASIDGAYCIPNGVKLTSAESSELSLVSSDICTYASERIAQYVTGAMNLEEDWDEMIATVKSMNIDRCIEIEQQAYDRYAAR